MDIKTALQKKQALEEDIRKITQKYSEETSLKITDISITPILQLCTAEGPVDYIIDVKIEL